MSIIRKSVLPAAFCLFAATNATAAQGMFCKSSLTGFAFSSNGNWPAANASYRCNDGSEKTITQLYEAGWKLVQFTPIVGDTQHSNGFLLLFFEKQ